MVVVDKIRVNVFVAGEKLQEYELPPEERAEGNNSTDLTQTTTITATRYVEATPDTVYYLRCALRGGFDFGAANCLTFRIFIDGKKTRSVHISKRKYQKRGGYHAIVRGTHNGSAEQGWQRFPFKWAALNTTDESTNTVAQDQEQYAEMGTIRVEVWRKNGQKKEMRSARKAPDTERPVPEAAIKAKAIEVSTQYGPPTPVHRPKAWSSGTLDNEPITQFIFRYRKRSMMHSPYLGHDAELLTKKPEALEDLGIIPENPPPPPLEEKNPADMTRAELMQVARRFQTIRNQVSTMESR